MSRIPHPPSGARTSNTADDDDELNLFSSIEKALRSESKEKPYAKNLAEEFPDVFRPCSDSSPNDKTSQSEPKEEENLINRLKGELESLKKERQSIDMEKEWISKEKKELSRMRDEIESDKMMEHEGLQNAEILRLREKVSSLEQQLFKERQSWKEERANLLAQIGPMEEKQKPSVEPSPHSPLQFDFSVDFSYNPGEPQSEEKKKDGRSSLTFKDGSVGTLFRNGTKKVQRGNLTYVFFANGDSAIEYDDGSRAYKYKQNGTVEITLPDKSFILEFPNGQRENHFCDNCVLIQYPNGQKRLIYDNGDYELSYPSGKVEKCIKGQITISSVE